MKLAELNANQTAEVTFKARGCFHDYVYMAVFNGDDLTHLLVADAKTPHLRARGDMSPRDLVTLDRVFEHWRITQHQRSAHGTSDCEVGIRWCDENGVLEREDFLHAFPPPELQEDYDRFFIQTIVHTLMKRTREVAEERKQDFCDWALKNHPLREIRFLDEGTVSALLEPGHSIPVDTRSLSKTLARACSEQTARREITCQIYDAKRRVETSTFKVRNWKLSQRIGELPFYLFGGLALGLILVIWVTLWLLWWPIGTLRRLVWSSRKAA